MPSSRCLVSSLCLRFALTPKALASQSYNGLALPSVVSLSFFSSSSNHSFPSSSKRPGRSRSLSFISFFRVSVTLLFLSFRLWSGTNPSHNFQLDNFIFFLYTFYFFSQHLSICKSRTFSLALLAWLSWLTPPQSSADLLSVVLWHVARTTLVVTTAKTTVRTTVKTTVKTMVRTTARMEATTEAMVLVRRPWIPT